MGKRPGVFVHVCQRSDRSAGGCRDSFMLVFSYAAVAGFAFLAMTAANLTLQPCEKKHRATGNEGAWACWCMCNCVVYMYMLEPEISVS